MSLNELAEQTIRDGGGVPSFLGYHGFPGEHLRLGERADRARHPVGRAGARRRRPDLRRLRRDPGRLARRRGGHAVRRHRLDRRPGAVAGVPGGHGGHPASQLRAARRKADRHLARGADRLRGRLPAGTASATGSLPSTAATGSARRCTWTRSCPTSVSPGRGPRLVAGGMLAIEPMLTIGQRRHPGTGRRVGR